MNFNLKSESMPYGDNFDNDFEYVRFRLCKVDCLFFRDFIFIDILIQLLISIL